MTGAFDSTIRQYQQEQSCRMRATYLSYYMTYLSYSDCTYTRNIVHLIAQYSTYYDGRYCFLSIQQGCGRRQANNVTIARITALCRWSWWKDQHENTRFGLALSSLVAHGVRGPACLIRASKCFACALTKSATAISTIICKDLVQSLGTLKIGGTRRSDSLNVL